VGVKHLLLSCDGRFSLCEIGFAALQQEMAISPFVEPLVLVFELLPSESRFDVRSFVPKCTLFLFECNVLAFDLNFSVSDFGFELRPNMTYALIIF
jgi:hypothetical protein